MSRPQSSKPGTSPIPPPKQPNTQTITLNTDAGRILCIADIRGKFSSLNDLAREVDAIAIIHTGDFGFFEAASLERIGDRTLRHLTQYSPLIPGAQRTHLLAPENPASVIRSTVMVNLLSEFPLLLSGQIKLRVPVFTLWGACEDVQVLEKFRAGTYSIDNLHVLDEATTRLLDIGGVKLRLLGLGGALVMHKMFDNGDGAATIAGGQGTMWTTALQIGELVDTAQRVYDPTETRLLVSHASPGREGLISQLALVVKADLTVSAGLHFRYGSSYNEFSVQGDFEGYRHKLTVGKDNFYKVWEGVKGQVDEVIDENQRVLLDKFLHVIDRVPPAQGAAPGTANVGDEPAWKNCWNWNLCDAAYGSLVLDIKEGRVSAELKSQGFNYAYRRNAAPVNNAATAPSAATNPPTTSGTPAPTDKPAPPHMQQKSQAPSPAPPTPAPAPTSGTPKPANGSASSVSPAPTSTPSPGDKADKLKAKKDALKEKRDRQKADKAEANAGAAGSGRDTPDVTPAAGGVTGNGKSTPVPSETEPRSPTSASASGGATTPTSRRPPRNPWTLFIRMEIGANEEQLRTFFGPATSGITRINYAQSKGGKEQKVAFVEFGDEEAMKAGLEKHQEKLNDHVPEVKIAQSFEEREKSGDFRGAPRGRGRGAGRGFGGFASRGFAAAGLTRGGASKPSGTPPAPSS